METTLTNKRLLTFRRNKKDIFFEIIYNLKTKLLTKIQITFRDR
jgi:hypothetical protein